MRVRRYLRQTQQEGCMFGVTFRLLWPAGTSSLFISLIPPHLLLSIPFYLPSGGKKEVLIYAGHGWPSLIYSGLFLKENGERKQFSLGPAGGCLTRLVCPAAPLRSDRNRRYFPRQRVERAHTRARSDLRDSAPSSYSPSPLSLLCCRRDKF
jgi:hypothetical protein